jgi:hypothetical protein
MKKLLSTVLAIALIISVFAIPTTANPAPERLPNNHVLVEVATVTGLNSIHGGFGGVGSVRITNLTNLPIENWAVVVQTSFSITTMPDPNTAGWRMMMTDAHRPFLLPTEFSLRIVSTHAPTFSVYEFSSSGILLPNEPVNLLFEGQNLVEGAPLIMNVSAFAGVVIVPETPATTTQTEPTFAPTEPSTAPTSKPTIPTEITTQPTTEIAEITSPTTTEITTIPSEITTQPTTEITTIPTTERTTRATTERTTSPTSPTEITDTSPSEPADSSPTEVTDSSPPEPTDSPSDTSPTTPTSPADSSPTTPISTAPTTPTSPPETLLPDGHAVIFNPDNGADSLLMTAVADGAQIGELPAFARSGYTFRGWFAELGFVHGDVNGDGNIDVSDALQILRFLVGLPNIIAAEGEGSNAWNAALIVSETQPQVNDALQILRKLVGLPNQIADANPPISPQTPITADTNFIARWAAITPDVPANFTAESAGRTVRLNWNAVDWADGYEVMRSGARLGEYSLIATITAGSAATFRDNIAAGSRWFYTVRAFRNTERGRLYSEFSTIIEGGEIHQ